MRYSADLGPAPGEWRASRSRDPGFTRVFVSESASMRLAAAMAGPRSSDWGACRLPDAPSRLDPIVGEAAESDGRYFQRRSAEERRAARDAAGPEARAAHHELAARYARLSRQTMRPRGKAPLHRQERLNAASETQQMERN